MSSRQKRGQDNHVYKYRPVYDDPKEVQGLLERWAGAAVQYGFDIGTKENPMAEGHERQEIIDNARVVFEALGVLPAGYIPPLEDDDSTRSRCAHSRCRSCGRCRCEEAYVRNGLCEECKWDQDSRSVSGRTATTARKAAPGRAD